MERTITLPLLLLLTLAGVKAQQPAPKPTHPMAGRNLLVNGDAEASEGKDAAAWGDAAYYADRAGTITAVNYGAPDGVFPKGWGAQNGHGERCLKATLAKPGEVRSPEQRIDLTQLADTIDQGKARGRIAGQFAAIGNPALKGHVVVEYRNADNKPLLTLRTRQQAWDVSGNEARLVRSSESGVIPAGTRSAVVYVIALVEGNAATTGSFVMDDITFDLHLR
jgi:hypothetical protein